MVNQSAAIHVRTEGAAVLVETDIGQLPKDWSLVRLGDVYDFQNGVNADAKDYGRGIRFANVLEVLTHSHLRASQIPGQVSLSNAIISAFLVKDGDILFNRTSETQEELGLASVYGGDEPIVFGGFVIRARQRQPAFHPPYTGYAFRAPFVRSQIIAAGQGAVRANIGQQSLRKVLAPLPSIDEQIAIAEALSDADALIESLEALIAKKRAIKQGAMQDLLSGRKRLPGFNGEWIAKPLVLLADIRSGGTPSTTNQDFWEGDIPWCTPTDITALAGAKYIGSTVRKLTEKGLRSSSAEIIPPYSVIMTSRATIGECAINLLPMTTNQGFKNLVPNAGTDTEFLYYLMCMQTERLIAMCGGSTFLEIGKAQLSRFELVVPQTKPEQQAIAEILSDIDGDLLILMERLEKSRRIKQGMIQELLTGRVRLV